MIRKHDDEITESELSELHDHEHTIALGLKNFMQVGKALREIRDKRLYREKYGTFARYCERRWQIHRSRAYRLIGAASVGEALSPIGDIPRNESQARPLAKLSVDPRIKAWRDAKLTAPNGKVTGLQVQRAVGRLSNPNAKAGRIAPSKPEESTPKEPPETEQVVANVQKRSPDDVVRELIAEFGADSLCEIVQKLQKHLEK